MGHVEAEQELTFIRKMIEESRRILIYDGVEYIVWGLFVVFGMLGTYFTLEMNKAGNIVWIWSVCIGAGWIYSIVQSYRRRKLERVRTLTGRIFSMVWIATGISMTILGFVGTATGFVESFAVTPIMAIVLAIPYMVSGVLIENKLLLSLSLGWWIGGIAMMFWPGRHIFIIFACMIILLQIVPGVMLRLRWKQEYGRPV